MKKSKVFMALAAVLLVVLCCSAAGCFGHTVSDNDKNNTESITSVQSNSDGFSETDAKNIYSGYRQDRIEVCYINASGEHLSWEVIHDFNSHSSKYDEDVLLQIPEGISLVEAIEYCNNSTNIYYTEPGEDYIKFVIHGESRDIPDIQTNSIVVKYKNNSSYRLSWPLIYEMYGRFAYYIPENMTFPDAFAYCNSIDDIVQVGYVFKSYYANG